MKIGTYGRIAAILALTLGSSQLHAEQPEIISHRIKSSGDAGILTGTTSVVKQTMVYHNGPVMAQPNVYVIWYGNWNRTNNTDTPAGQQIVRDLLNALGGSPYFAINKTYSTTATTISGNVTFAGETTDTGSQGLKMGDAMILSVVNRAITNSSLPKDANGIYFVLTSSDITETSGFCKSYCGWHTHGTISKADIKYAFIGNSAQCLNACAAQTNSPNGNPGVDGMCSVISHELEEATTDPDINAWYDRTGAENADKCAWTFGQNQYQVANGSWANMGWDYLDPSTGLVAYHRDFLIQRNLIRTLNNKGVESDYCATGYDPATQTFQQ